MVPAVTPSQHPSRQPWITAAVAVLALAALALSTIALARSGSPDSTPVAVATTPTASPEARAMLACQLVAQAQQDGTVGDVATMRHLAETAAGSRVQLLSRAGVHLGRMVELVERTQGRDEALMRAHMMGAAHQVTTACAGAGLPY